MGLVNEPSTLAEIDALYASTTTYASLTTQDVMRSVENVVSYINNLPSPTEVAPAQAQRLILLGRGRTTSTRELKRERKGKFFRR